MKHIQTSACFRILLLQFRQQRITCLFCVSKQHSSVRVVEDGIVHCSIPNTQRPLHHYHLHQYHISDCAASYLNAVSYNRPYLVCDIHQQLDRLCSAAIVAASLLML